MFATLARQLKERHDYDKFFFGFCFCLVLIYHNAFSLMNFYQFTYEFKTVIIKLLL